jgi:hypothetical protein
VPENIGNVVVIHGLNLDPRRMHPLGQSLACERLAPVPLVLSGHDPLHSMDVMKRVSADLWLSQCAEVRRASQPVGALAYSLGALVWLVSLMDAPQLAGQPSMHPRFQILLAPAIGLRWYTRLIQLLQPLGGLTIPSMSHPAYRRHKGLPIPAYRALFELTKRLKQMALAGIRLDIPTLVVLNNKDELIDPAATLALLTQVLVQSPRVFFVNGRSSQLTPSYAHLMLDKQCLGDDEYARLLKEVTGFVREFS